MNNYQSDPTRSIVVIWVINFRTDLILEICSKRLIRAIGKVLLMKLSYRGPIKNHKGNEKWLLFVNKQLFWCSASITLDNNNDVLTDF